jgi:hypothetical protein
VNRALAKTTGYQVTAVSANAASAAKGRPGRPGQRPRRSANRGGRTPSRRRRSAVRPAADPLTDRLVAQPIFVISSVRSGSTLLRLMLNAHPQLHAPHELHLRRLSVNFETKLAKEAMNALELNGADLEHLLWDRVLHRELVRSGKRYIVDKTPGNAFGYHRLSTVWPEARFIFLLRHPASIARSWAKATAARNTEQQATAGALKFVRAVQRARDALDGVTVRYEDLTRDPTGETQRICDFLRIPWDAAMVNYGQNPVPLTRGLGDWEDKIRSGEVHPVRDLPTADDVPELLRGVTRQWGYLPHEATGAVRHKPSNAAVEKSE